MPNPRVALRQPFPASPPVLADLALDDLAHWFQLAEVQRLAWPRFSVAGFVGDAWDIKRSAVSQTELPRPRI